MNAQVWIAILVGLAAAIDDLARRHIANWIPAAALAGGFGWQIGQGGWQGAFTALGGTMAGFAVFLVFYLLGGMGGGDVKLMAGFGALLGAGGLLEAALWTAGVGGILAVGAIAWRALRRLPGRPVTATAGDLPEGGGKAVHTAAGEQEASIAYAPAIALGVWLSLLAKS